MFRRRRDAGDPGTLPAEFRDPSGREDERLVVDEDGITAIGQGRHPLRVRWRDVSRFGALHDPGGARMIGMVLTEDGLNALGLPRPATTGAGGFHALLPSVLAYGRQQDELAQYLEQLRRHAADR